MECKSGAELEHSQH